MSGAQTVPLLHYVMPLVAIMGVVVATSVRVNVTGQSRAGCCESVLGLAGRVHGNWVGEVHQCYSDSMKTVWTVVGGKTVCYTTCPYSADVGPPGRTHSFVSFLNIFEP